jgi:hypothetical protein
VIAAFQTRPGSLLANIDSGLFTLHLLIGVERSALSEDCFASSNENDTTLDTGCPLSALGFLGSKSKQPLIIKKMAFTIPGQTKGSKNSVADVNVYWRVSGRIINSCLIKGVRSRVYRIADSHLGYCEQGVSSVFYDENEKNLV